MNKRLLKKMFSLAPLIVALSLILFISLSVLTHFYSKSSRTGLGNEILAGSFPSMQNVGCTFLGENEQRWSVHAETVSLRDRRLGEAIFKSFKDVVLKQARVSAGNLSPADFLRWTANSDILIFSALMLVDNDSWKELPVVTSRVVFDGLEVYATDDGGAPQMILSAEQMIKDPLLDEITFKGRLTLDLNRGEHLVSPREARWSPAEGTMYFPEGYYVNEEFRESGRLALAGKVDTVLCASNPSGPAPPAKPLLGDTSKIRKILKNRDPRIIRNLMWQILALNAGAVTPGKFGPMLFLGPGFQLGEFNPGGLMASGLIPE